MAELDSTLYSQAMPGSRTGIVIVSHSGELARGAARLAAQMAGPGVRIEPAGGDAEGGLGTSRAVVQAAIARADQGDGVVVLGDLGSAILTVRHLLAEDGDGHVRLADAPLVEGLLAAAAAAGGGACCEDVVRAAEDARGARKL
jgi:dihydroxyacetone kinase phosphotransfer subunit